MKNRAGFLVISALALSGLALMLTACGGGGGSSTGTLNLSLTDAPIDSAVSVVVDFDAVELQSAEGERVRFDLVEEGAPCHIDNDPTLCQIDLMQFTGTESFTILDGVELPDGQYSWMRLEVNAELDTVFDSYIELSDHPDCAPGMYELDIPSGAETGLKLNRPFMVAAGGVTDLTIDFDLRKSVHEPQPNDDLCTFKLRPTLRLVDNLEVGTLTGSVDSGLITDGCTGAVYVFDAAASAPDDVDGIDADGADPITTALLSDALTYTVGFLVEGDYLVAFTCDAGVDDPEIDNDIEGEPVAFSSATTVGITVNETLEHTFGP
jgi:hypothetical protein